MDTSYDILSNEANSLLMLPGEKTILQKRQHMFAVVIPVGIAIVLGVGILTATSVGFLFFPNASILLFIAMLFTVLATASLCAKILMDWYFHIYIVTNRRILEITYKPFFSQDINDVLLEQVRCTEIDIKIQGYIHGLMDIGDIIITFDRPTHQQEFILHDIKAPRKTGTLLGHLLNTPTSMITASQRQKKWYKDSQTEKYIFSEDIYPKQTLSA